MFKENFIVFINTIVFTNILGFKNEKTSKKYYTRNGKYDYRSADNVLT